MVLELMILVIRAIRVQLATEYIVATAAMSSRTTEDKELILRLVVGDCGGPTRLRREATLSNGCPLT